MEKKLDEYLACKDYKGHPRSEQNSDFSIFQKKGEFYFAMLDEKNRVALRSEGYASENGRNNGIASVTKNREIEERFKVVKIRGKYYLCLFAGNNQEIARSCPFASGRSAEKALLGGGKVAAAPKKRKKRRTTPKAEKVEVGSGSYPCSSISYKIFRSGGNNKHYFTYRDKNDRAILISSNIRGYETLEETKAVIKAIAVSGSKTGNFEERPTTNGKFYYYLKNDNGKNIGKSFFFDNEVEMRAAMKLFDCGIVAGGNAPTSSSDRRDDDYLVCSAYEGHTIDGDGFSRFTNGGEFFFAMHGADGAVKLRSERYTSESGRDNGIKAVKNNRELSERYKIEEARNIFYVILKAGNHQEIGRSCPYKSRAAADSHISDPLGLAAVAAKEARAKRDADALAIADARASKATTMSGDAASSKGNAGASEDDYLKCSAYEGHKIEADGFSRFSQDGEHYFALYDDAGKVRLRSEGYTTTQARDNGIDAVIRNRENPKRYFVEEKMGYHFVVLKAGNHQEIARSCPYKDAAAAAGFAANPTSAFAAVGLAAGLSASASGEDSKKKTSDVKAKTDRAVADKAAAAKLAADRAAAEKATAAKLASDKTAADKAAKIAAAAAATAAMASGAGSTSKTAAGGSAASVSAGDSSRSAASGGRSGGGIPWWLWLLLALLLLFLILWKGCGLCNTPNKAVTPLVIEEQVIEDVEPAIVAEPEVEKEETSPAQPTTTLANSPSHRLFNLPPAGATGKKLPFLGSNPEFGDSHGLTPTAFYNKLKVSYDSNAGDRKFLDEAFKAMGYVNGFGAATPAMFSAVELPQGTTGNLGYSAQHKTGYYTLPDAQRHRLAFKIKGANGRDLHFMKTCGNHFYFRA